MSVSDFHNFFRTCGQLGEDGKSGEAALEAIGSPLSTGFYEFALLFKLLRCRIALVNSSTYPKFYPNVSLVFYIISYILACRKILFLNMLYTTIPYTYVGVVDIVVL